jgi:Holliday junction resolvasome RuvABC endonuclease subunit
VSTVIGIDPSIRNTGVCILNNNDQRLVYNIKVSSKDVLPVQLNTIRKQILDIAFYYCSGKDACWLAVIEGPISPLALGAHGGKGFNNNIMAIGCILSALAELELPTLIVAPNTRAKYATGKGNAKKDDVHQIARELFGLPLEHDNNAADALILAYMAAELVYCKHTTTGFQTPFTPKEGYRDMTDSAYDQIDSLYMDWQEQCR